MLTYSIAALAAATVFYLSIRYVVEPYLKYKCARLIACPEQAGGAQAT